MNQAEDDFDAAAEALLGDLKMDTNLASLKVQMRQYKGEVLGQFRSRATGSSADIERTVTHLEDRLQASMDAWGREAGRRQERLRAKQEAEAQQRQVRGELRKQMWQVQIKEVARMHFTEGVYRGEKEAEALWVKEVAPRVRKLLQRDPLAQQYMDEVEVELRDQKLAMMQSQMAANKKWVEQALEAAYLMKGGRLVELILHLNYDNKLRGVDIMTADTVPNTLHILITTDGSVLGRLPRTGDEVAIYSIRDQALWKSELTGSYWNGKTKYSVRGHHWKLGAVSVPRECLFLVEAKDKYFTLWGMERGYLRRRTVCVDPAGNPYTLAVRDESAYFKQSPKPMSWYQQQAMTFLGNLIIGAITGTVAIAMA